MNRYPLAVATFLFLFLSGCGNHPQVTVEADFVTIAADGTREVHNSASMSGRKTGGSVSGGMDDASDLFTVTLTEISGDHAKVEVSHPQHESKTLKINYGESAELEFGENAILIRADRSR